MNTWDRINRTGFFPQLVTASLKRALGGQTPRATLCQVDAAFDQGSVFRHLSLVTLTDSVLIHMHVDELEDGGASVGMGIFPLSRLGTVSSIEVYREAMTSMFPAELTISVDLGAMRRSEVEPAQCGDPSCTADHGYTVASFPDDLNFRISVDADGVDAMTEARQFVDLLSSATRAHH